MKKITKSVLAIVLSSTFAVMNAQQKEENVKTKDIEGVVVTALGIKREKKSLGYGSQSKTIAQLNFNMFILIFPNLNFIFGQILSFFV